LSNKEREVRDSFPPIRRNHPALGALLLALAIFALLWLLNIPFRRVYQANDNDVTAFVDALLLLPGSHWQGWFTQGHSHFFDSYPEWPWGLTPFARPAFQFLIYLAHFAFGRDWSAYLAINYLSVAGVAAVAFALARTVLGLGVAPSLLSAAFVLVSPAVLGCSIWEVGFASESLASLLIGCAFIAGVARRDIVCLALLLVALLIKETAVWAPFAAAFTALFRPAPGATPRHRILSAVTMFLPLMVWLTLRLSFFGGIGGSYATVSFTPFKDFVSLLGWKLEHLHRLFVSQEVFVASGPWAVVDRALMIATYLLLASLLTLWMVGSLRVAWDKLSALKRELQWPTTEPALLVTLWAVMGLAFYFALGLSSPRYAASAVMFLWPALVAEVMRRGRAARVALVISFVLVLVRTSDLLVELNPPSEQSYVGRFLHAIAAMDDTLRAVPADIQQIYVLSSGGLVTATPKYLQAFLDMPSEIIRVIDIHSYCKREEGSLRLDHDIMEGLVILRASLPAHCGSFFFDMAGRDSTSLVDGRLRRNESISYELFDAQVIDHKGPLKPAIEPGSQVTVQIRPHGPARFVIERGGGEGITWFDVH